MLLANKNLISQSESFSIDEGASFYCFDNLITFCGIVIGNCMTPFNFGRCSSTLNSVIGFLYYIISPTNN